MTQQRSCNQVLKNCLESRQPQPAMHPWTHSTNGGSNNQNTQISRIKNKRNLTAFDSQRTSLSIKRVRLQSHWTAELCRNSVPRTTNASTVRQVNLAWLRVTRRPAKGGHVLLFEVLSSVRQAVALYGKMSGFSLSH